MRNLSLDVQNALLSRNVRVALLVELTYTNETVYIWNGIGSLAWNGQTWLGVGKLGAVSAIAESSSVEAQGMSLKLSGIDPQLLADSLSHVGTGGAAAVYLAFFTTQNVLIGNPVPLFIGFMDQPALDIGVDTVTITQAVENRLSDLQRSRGGRFTDADQRARYPSDGGLQYVSWLQDEFLNWRG